MKLVLTVIATLLLVSACDSCGLAKRHIPTIRWDYGADHSGPSHWSILDPAYVICSDTMNQSPIDFNPHTIGPIAACENVDLAMDYKPLRNAVAHWNGHTVEVDWTPSRGMHNNSITLKGKKYNLVQFHFHTPSEHRVNNRHADAELHLVHRSPEDQALAVVGVLLEVVAQNVRLFDFVKVLHDKVNVPCAGVHGEEVAVDKEEVDRDEDGEEAEEEKDAEDEDEDQEGVFEAQHMESYEDGHVDENQDNDTDIDTDIDDDVQGVDPVPLVNPDSYFENFNNDGHSKNDLCHGRALTSEDAVKIDVPLKVVNFAPFLRVLGTFTDRWVYQGSLTTPPCSEHVSWNVMQKTFPIGIQQLKALVALQGFNARGIMENRIQKEEDGAGPK